MLNALQKPALQLPAGHLANLQLAGYFIGRYLGIGAYQVHHAEGFGQGQMTAVKDGMRGGGFLVLASGAAA